MRQRQVTEQVRRVISFVQRGLTLACANRFEASVLFLVRTRRKTVRFVEFVLVNVMHVSSTEDGGTTETTTRGPNSASVRHGGRWTVVLLVL